MIAVSSVEEVLSSILSNPDYVSDDVIKNAIEDTKEIVKEKKLQKPFILDIALYRVFIRVNLEVPQNIQNAYKEALKRLKEAPIITDSGEFRVKVSTRENVWI